VERRIAGIVKWLERCLKACKAGTLESALMDVECARADMERLRDEVWKKLGRRHSAKKRMQFIETRLKVILGAFVVVLTAATPVALLQEGLPREGQERESVTLEWVTPDEKTLLGHLRKHLSDSNSFASIQPEPQRLQSPQLQSPELPQTRPQARISEGERVIRAAPKREPKDATRDDAVGIPYDRIISLVQAGEKAMKNDEPAIKIEK
jgi:hypothetical protein